MFLGATARQTRYLQQHEYISEMRDFVLLAALPLLIYAIYQRPFIGLGMWIWTAMFFPNGWVYGVAGSIRYNFLFAGLTVFGYLVSNKKEPLQLGHLGSMIILFFLWTTLTSIFGLAPSEIVWDFWGRLAKIIMLFIFVLLVMNKKLHIDFFLWCLILSIGFFAGLEGLKYVASGGGHRIEGMSGHVIGDRNDLALALAMMLPICFYLLGEYGAKSWVLKFGLLGLIALTIVSIIGTHSRGGLVALLGVGAYLFIKSDRKLLFALLGLVFVVALQNLVPEEWFNRMDTIGKADSDASFMGRVVAWKLSFILAIQHPLFAGGFKGLEHFPVWSALSQDFADYPFFYTGTATPDPIRARAAHSIYFQVLGDHGFIGLVIFLWILMLSFIKGGRIASINRMINGPIWISKLAAMLQLSIFTYALGGIALSFAYFDMIYAIFGIIIVMETKILKNIMKEQRI
jgi:probable O-glycosylation ligase (exosortase A-associated)